MNRNTLHEISDVLTEVALQGGITEQQNLEFQNGLMHFRNVTDHISSQKSECLDKLLIDKTTFLFVIENPDRFILEDEVFFTAFSQHHSDDKQICLALCNRGLGLHAVLRYASFLLLDDEDFIIACIKIHPISMIYATNRLINNVEFITKAVRESCDIIPYIGRDIKNDPVLVTELLKIDGFGLEHVAEEFKNNKHMVKVAIKDCIEPLNFASQEIKNDREFLREVIQRDGYALKFASRGLQDDKGLVLTAIENFPHAIKYASHRLRNDKGVAFKAIQRDIRTKDHVGNIKFSNAFKKEFKTICKRANRNRNSKH